MIIAIEGMDGVGKSTCARSLANYLNYEYVSTPIQTFFKGGNNNPEFKNTMNIMYDMTDSVVKSYFIGLGNLVACRHKDNIVLDRHFASNYFWNGTPESEIVFKHLIELIGKPDITFLLKGSVQTRMKRLYERDPNGWDLKDPEKHVIGHDKMEVFLIRFDIPYIAIDTDNINQQKVFETVKQHVINMSKGKKR